MSEMLSGVRIVELASWTYVPAAGAALSDWGAISLVITSHRRRRQGKCLGLPANPSLPCPRHQQGALYTINSWCELRPWAIGAHQLGRGAKRYDSQSVNAAL